MDHFALALHTDSAHGEQRLHDDPPNPALKQLGVKMRATSPMGRVPQRKTSRTIDPSPSNVVAIAGASQPI